MDDATARLLSLLELTPHGEDRFRAPTPSGGPPRLFGGQVASQALRAATLTVDAERPPHSLHAYFIRPGAPGVPLDLDVERTRDGRSFATRRVTASQEGRPIFVADASFHVREPGDDWQVTGPLDVPGPDEVEGESPFGRFDEMSPLEIRTVRGRADAFVDIHPFWVRTTGTMPDDPVLHACVATFISDMAVVASARAPGSTSIPFAGASLDHAVWFHRDLRVDDWLLYSVEPVSNAGARGLALGAMHTVDGVRVLSMAQEALLRPASTPAAP